MFSEKLVMTSEIFSNYLFCKIRRDNVILGNVSSVCDFRRISSPPEAGGSGWMLTAKGKVLNSSVLSIHHYSDAFFPVISLTYDNIN